jgi:hypothetical protein
MWFDAGGQMALLLLAIFMLLVAFAIYAGFEDAKEWRAFSDAHNCKKVAHVTGDVQSGLGYGMGANGQYGTVVIMSVSPDKTAWFCDDGVTYWR